MKITQWAAAAKLWCINPKISSLNFCRFFRRNFSPGWVSVWLRHAIFFDPLWVRSKRCRAASLTAHRSRIQHTILPGMTDREYASSTASPLEALAPVLILNLAIDVTIASTKFWWLKDRSYFPTDTTLLTIVRSISTQNNGEYLVDLGCKLRNIRRRRFNIL